MQTTKQQAQETLQAETNHSFYKITKIINKKQSMKQFSKQHK